MMDVTKSRTENCNAWIESQTDKQRIYRLQFAYALACDLLDAYDMKDRKTQEPANVEWIAERIARIAEDCLVRVPAAIRIE